MPVDAFLLHPGGVFCFDDQPNLSYAEMRRLNYWQNSITLQKCNLYV